MTDKYIQEGDLILVEVPEGSIKFNVGKRAGDLHFFHSNGRNGLIELPHPGHYELIGKASELKWSDWVSIVDKESDESESLNCWWYKDYTQFEIWTKDAVKSGLSLLKKHNLNSQTTIILKKKQ